MLFLLFLQDKPIIVDVGKAPEPTHDISLDFVVGMFAMAGVFLLAALIGCLLVAGGILLYKRWKSRSGSDEPSHTSLRI
jgi:hypothetical protein